MTRTKLIPVVVLGLSLLLTGCFRQAEEPFEETTADPLVDSADVSETPPPISTVSFGPTNTVPLLVTVEATDTPPPGSTDSGQSAISLTSTPAQTFITPGSPLDSLIVFTNTPTLGTPGSATPGGLVTPTDFFNADELGEDSACEYIVQSGDTLFRIAIRNETTVAAIMAANEMDNDVIFPGDALIIPGCGDEDDGTPQPSAEATPLPAGVIEHTVASGEVLGRIAERYGVPQSVIIELNNLTNPNSLQVGQKLLIPVDTQVP